MEIKGLKEQSECEGQVFLDGSQLRIRSIRASDKDMFSRVFSALSSETRYRRCFTLKTALTPEELDFFCDVDGYHHAALVAVSLDEKSNEVDGIGGARFIRLPENEEVAEIAFLVADAWQRKGVGRLLLERLVKDAAQKGVKKLRCYLLAENVQARKFIRSLGGKYQQDIVFKNDGSVISAEFSIEHLSTTSGKDHAVIIYDLLDLAVQGYSAVPTRLALMASDIWWREIRRNLSMWKGL